MNLQKFDDGWKIVASHTSVAGVRSVFASHDGRLAREKAARRRDHFNSTPALVQRLR
jgi:hypothetical protein